MVKDMLPKEFPFTLAPMDNLTHPIFRKLVAGLLPENFKMAFFSPAINPNSVIHKNFSIKETVPINRGETLYYNIMHGEPDVVVAGMDLLLPNGPAGFNLNCGCPRAKVQKAEGCPVGVALMACPDRVAKIIKAAKRSFPETHFSVKIRTGVQHNIPELFDFCKQIQDAGADAIIFHARSAEDQYKRPAKHSLFGELRKQVTIPLIGNGDIQTAEKALSVMAEYNLDGIMVGRGALVHPDIFRSIALKLSGESLPSPTMGQKEKELFLLRFARDIEIEFGTAVMVKRLRLLCRWFSRGLEFGLTLEGNLAKAKSAIDVEDYIRDFFSSPKKQYAEIHL